MSELRVFYEKDESAPDLWAWLYNAHPSSLQGSSLSDLQKGRQEERPDDYIDLGCPHLGLKVRGGFGRRQQGLELKTRCSKDAETGVEVWMKDTFSTLPSSMDAYSQDLLTALKGKVRGYNEVIGLLDEVNSLPNGLPSRIYRVEKSRKQFFINLATISQSHHGSVVVEQTDFDLKTYEQSSGKVTTKNEGSYRSICVEGATAEALRFFMDAFLKANFDGKDNYHVMGYPEWLHFITRKHS